MGVLPFWPVKDVLCLTVARTSAPMVASQSKTFLELLEGSLGGARMCAVVHKRTSSNGPSLSVISFTVGVLGGVEMRIYTLSPLSNVLTIGIP